MRVAVYKQCKSIYRSLNDEGVWFTVMQELDSARLSARMLRRRSDPQVWMLFAAAPGGEVSGDVQSGAPSAA